MLASAAQQVNAAKAVLQRAHQKDTDERAELEQLLASANQRKKFVADDELAREKQKISDYKKELKQYPKGKPGKNAMKELYCQMLSPKCCELHGFSK